MTTLTIDLPDTLLGEQSEPEALARDVRLTLAVDWYRRGLVSQGRAAEFAGMARADFIDELAAREVPADIDLGELKAELRRG